MNMLFMSKPIVVTGLISMLLATAGCRRDTETNAAAPVEPQAEPRAEPRAQPPEAPRGPIDPAFKDRIYSTAIGYFDYPRVDDKPHWAPGPCAPPSAFEDQPRVRLSSAGTNSLHSEKLYYLFVKDHESYLKPTAGSVPVGQVIVKQAYLAYELKKDPGYQLRERTIIERSGRKYTTGYPLALFIMMKLDEKTPHTDHGWIYGIADFNGEVKAAGVIEACASCHAHAAHDRLFGPSSSPHPPSPPSPPSTAQTPSL